MNQLLIICLYFVSYILTYICGNYDRLLPDISSEKTTSGLRVKFAISVGGWGGPPGFIYGRHQTHTGAPYAHIGESGGLPHPKSYLKA